MGQGNPKKGRKRAAQAPAAGRETTSRNTGAAVAIIDYKALFKHSPDAIFVTDTEGRCIGVNDAARKLTGYPQKDLLNMRFSDLIDPSEHEDAAEHLERARQKGRSLRTGTVVGRNGRTRPAEFHAFSLGNGTIQQVVRDISRFADTGGKPPPPDIIDSMLARMRRLAILSADGQHRITSWNPAAETLFGYTADEAIGLPVTDLIPERLRPKYLKAVQAGLRGKSGRAIVHTLTTEALRKDGTEVFVEASVHIGKKGDDVVLTGLFRDATEHHKVVEELNDALQRLRFHISRMPLAYIAWDRGFRVEEWNPAAERIFGYTRAEALGRHAYELIVPPEARSAVDSVWEKLLKGDTSSHSINENTRKGGTRLTCEWFNTPVHDSSGNIRGAVSMAMDISEHEAMGAQLRNAQRLESLGVLASGVAHDFNSSLMVILGNTTLLRGVRGLPSKALEYIESIESAGSRANDLIKHLLTYARTGRHNPQPTDLNSVIREALGFVHASLGKEYELDLRLAKRLPAVLADRSQVEQILLNLCLNAKQAMGTFGTISITTGKANLSSKQVAKCVPHDGKPGLYVRLVVSDTGCGMDEVTVHRIFDPFFTTKAEGHGLGLAAVLGILRQHGAMACVDSKVGKGTKIQVCFPVDPAAEKARPIAPVRGRGARNSRR